MHEVSDRRGLEGDPTLSTTTTTSVALSVCVSLTVTSPVAAGIGGAWRHSGRLPEAVLGGAVADQGERVREDQVSLR